MTYLNSHLCCSRSGRQENGVDDCDTTHRQFGIPTPDLTSPAGAFYIMESRLIEGILTLEDNVRYVLFYTVINLLVYLNSAINFLLYVLTGRKFREELFKMFGKGNKVGAAITTGTAG